MSDEIGREPWQWEEAEWRQRVNRVRAGRRLAPAQWPDGKPFAVAILSLIHISEPTRPY